MHMRKKKGFRGVIYFCILLILILVMIYSGLRFMESTAFYYQENPKKDMRE